MRLPLPATKPIKPDEFFKKIALNAGITDLDTVKNVYYGMIRTMGRELRDKHIVKLPDWGQFVIKIYSARRHIGVTGRKKDLTYSNVPATPMVKFIPGNDVKAYFRSLSL
jgi:nucleoid DNA-binding protein